MIRWCVHHVWPCVPEYLKTAYHRKRAAPEECLVGQAPRFRLESAAVVVPEFASVVEFEPRAFRAQALSVASVPEQTAYTPLPTVRKSRGERVLGVCNIETLKPLFAGEKKAPNPCLKPLFCT